MSEFQTDLLLTSPEGNEVKKKILRYSLSENPLELPDCITAINSFLETNFTKNGKKDLNFFEEKGLENVDENLYGSFEDNDNNDIYNWSYLIKFHTFWLPFLIFFPPGRTKMSASNDLILVILKQSSSGFKNKWKPAIYAKWWSKVSDLPPALSATKLIAIHASSKYIPRNPHLFYPIINNRP